MMLFRVKSGHAFSTAIPGNGQQTDKLSRSPRQLASARAAGQPSGDDARDKLPGFANHHHQRLCRCAGADFSGAVLARAESLDGRPGYLLARKSLELAALQPHFPVVYRAALAVELPEGTRDANIAREALAWDMAPTSHSGWYLDAEKRRYGLVLSVTNMPTGGFENSAGRLKALMEQCG